MSLLSTITKSSVLSVTFASLAFVSLQADTMNPTQDDSSIEMLTRPCPCNPFKSEKRGPRGPAGTNGAPGTNGTNGVTGATGPRGAPGAQGAQGSVALAYGTLLSDPSTPIALTTAFVNPAPLTQDGNKISNMGVVGPSLLINQSGFYRVSYGVYGGLTTALEQIIPTTLSAVVGISGNTLPNPSSGVFAVNVFNNNSGVYPVSATKTSTIRLEANQTIALYLFTNVNTLLTLPSINLNATLMETD